MQPGLLGSLGRSWWVLVVYGVISVLFAVFAFMKPFAVVAALTWAIGIMALAEGVISAFAVFNRKMVISRGWMAFYALASIAFGLVTIINPITTASILLMFVAAWLIIGGIFRIILAIRIRKEVTGEWMIALSGVVAIVLGGLFFANPGAGLLTMMIWIAALALFYGILQIIVGLRLRKLAHPM
ncbi:HdeD family acid-resistance protein [Dokdonella sp.]|uniref:HdeD family acid-resistance protein n=1 Tax=Dokdonella sp. TaxID=2291710 RepID=UPI003C627181